MPKQFHAWYSPEADSKYGHAIYRHENGELVKITAVASNLSWGDEYLWPDKVYLGTVVKYVSNHWTPERALLREGFRFYA